MKKIDMQLQALNDFTESIYESEGKGKKALRGKIQFTFKFPFKPEGQLTGDISLEDIIANGEYNDSIGTRGENGFSSQLLAYELLSPITKSSRATPNFIKNAKARDGVITGEISIKLQGRGINSKPSKALVNIAKQLGKQEMELTADDIYKYCNDLFKKGVSENLPKLKFNVYAPGAKEDWNHLLVTAGSASSKLKSSGTIILKPTSSVNLVPDAKNSELLQEYKNR